MRFLRKSAVPFLILFPIELAIAIPLLLRLRTDRSSSDAEFAVAILIAALSSFAGSAIPIVLFGAVTAISRKFWRRASVWMALQTATRAVAAYTEPVEPRGIGRNEYGLIINLPLGTRNLVAQSSQFTVLNAATGEKWGVLEASYVSGDSCQCSVFDRTNPQFWRELERRMDSDASAPQGIIIRREFPDDYLTRLQTLLKVWSIRQ